MKTTLELPDEMMREVKIRAVHEHKKLKDIIAASNPARPKIPKPIKLRGERIRSEKIEAAIAWGRH